MTPRKFFLLGAVLCSFHVSAYDCTGKVNAVIAAPSGIVTVSFGNMAYQYLCSVSEKYNNITPESCKAIFTTVLSAKMADKQITFWFSDNSNDCTNANHPAWAEMKNWYYGPAIYN